MVQVMYNVNLHMLASKGYKLTGATVALDGSEDALISREAGVFWREMDMRREIDSAVAEVRAKSYSGELKWSYKSVRAYIPVYPKTGHLHVIRPGQEDEATPDPDGVPWEVENTTAGDGAEYVGDAPDDLAEGGGF